MPWRCEHCIWEFECKQGKCPSFVSKRDFADPPKEVNEE